MVASWLGTESSVVDLDGDVHLWDFGGVGRPIIFIHGLGGSRASWVSVIDAFRPEGRVVVPDLIGFGDTPPLGRSSEVFEQVELIAALISSLGAGRATLVGNSMGGLIAMLVAARYPELVERQVMVAAALPAVELRISPRTVLELGLPLVPLLGPQALRRLASIRSAEQQVDRSMELLMGDPSRLQPEAREILIEFAGRRREMAWAANAFADAARSITRILVPPRRFERDVRRIQSPGLIMQGDRDQIVRPASAKWLARRRPDWQFEMLAGVGHVPQLEVPQLFSGLVLDWLR
jgi:pimeloyl-ACP methyl ester carboxylesterase